MNLKIDIKILLENKKSNNLQNNKKKFNNNYNNKHQVALDSNH